MSPPPHAELISTWKAAHASNVVPPLGEVSPYQWAMACHTMFEAGEIDLVEYAARHLHAAYPELDYLATLVALFDAVPRHLPPPLAFRDQPGAEVQIVRNPESEAVLLCFCAAEGTLGLPLNFVHQWLGRLPVSLVYIKDFRDLSGALGFPSLAPGRAGSIAALRRIAEELGAKRILQRLNGRIERAVCLLSTARAHGQVQFDLPHHREDRGADRRLLREPAAVDRLNGRIDVGFAAPGDLEHATEQA